MHCHRGIVCICWSMNMMLQWTQRQLSVWLNYPLAFLARVCWEILPTIDAQISHLSNYGFHFWDGGERSIDYNFSFLKRLIVKNFQLSKRTGGSRKASVLAFVPTSDFSSLDIFILTFVYWHPSRESLYHWRRRLMIVDHLAATVSLWWWSLHTT